MRLQGAEGVCATVNSDKRNTGTSPWPGSSLGLSPQTSTGGILAEVWNELGSWMR